MASGHRLPWPSVFGPEDEVGEPTSRGLGPHFVEGRADGLKVRGSHLERRFVRLVGGADRVINARLARHLDVAAENVRDGALTGEIDQSINRPRECRPV
jgi:hypothetical protein